MQIATACSKNSESLAAIKEVCQDLLKQLSAKPNLLFFYSSAGYDGTVLLQELTAVFPKVPVHGGTSCRGIMTHHGAHCQDGEKSLGLLGVVDPEGAYGVGAAHLNNDPRAAAVEAARLALTQADREGEVPTMVWVTSAPGNEEAVILGLEDLFGPHVPVCGGSSADDTVSGNWKQFANGLMYENAVVVALLFAPGQLGSSFHSGYDPTSQKAIITKGVGRTIFELDGKPAADVYNDWLGGKLTASIATGGDILQRTNLHPLGRVAGLIGGIPYFQLSHPSSVTAERSLSLFSGIETGEEVWLMQGTHESLILRAERVAHSAVNSVNKTKAEIAGAMVIFCAGCMLTVKDQMNSVVQRLRQGLGEEVPFLGAFTFGEQGCFIGGENRHGNLMISLLVFTK